MNIFDEIEKERALHPDHMINVYSLRDHTLLWRARFKALEGYLKAGNVVLVDEDNALLAKNPV